MQVSNRIKRHLLGLTHLSILILGHHCALALPMDIQILLYSFRSWVCSNFSFYLY